MEHRKLLRRFWPRLMLHALLLCALCGVITGAACVFVVSGVYHILIRAASAGLILGVFGCGFAVGFVISMVLHYPTNKRIAVQLDATGLQERSGTMLEYAKKRGTLVQLQRTDAIAHIKETSPRQIPLRLSRGRLLTGVIAVILAVAMLLIPYDIFAPDTGLSPEELAKAQEVDALITQLREEIYNTSLSEEIIAQLEQILAELEQSLLATDDQLEQAVLIDQAREDMYQVMQSAISRYSIGAALQRYELPRPLGKDIAGDALHISEAMDDLELLLESDRALVTKLSNNISASLEKSGVGSEDSLYIAVQGFADGLAGLSYGLNPMPEGDPEEEGYDEGVYGEPEPEDPEALSVVFEQAEEAIMHALDEQLLLEAEFEQVDDAMSQGIQKLLGEKNQPGSGNSESSSQPGVQNESNLGSGSQGSGGQVGGMASGPAGSKPSTMLEEVYDPISGSVTYGEVFAAYYAQYLQSLESGDISEELQKLFDLYYSALS